MLNNANESNSTTKEMNLEDLLKDFVGVGFSQPSLTEAIYFVQAQISALFRILQNCNILNDDEILLAQKMTNTLHRYLILSHNSGNDAHNKTIEHVLEISDNAELYEALDKMDEEANKL